MLLVTNPPDLTTRLQAAPGQWLRYTALSPHFHSALPRPNTLEEGLGGWWFPPEYFSSPQRQEWSMGTLARTLRAGLVHHKPTQTCLGGPFGVKWGALMLLRAHWCFQQLRAGRCPPTVTQLSFNVKDEAEIVLGEVDWLLSEIESSSSMLSYA
jgi:hypothetical protein